MRARGDDAMADQSWHNTDACSRACGVSRAERSKTGISEASAYPLLTLVSSHTFHAFGIDSACVAV